MLVAGVRTHVATPTHWGCASELRRGEHGNEDRGSSSVEFAILFPIIVLLLLGGPQLTMWYFARETADAAATLAARAASADGADNATGQDAADTYLNRVGKGTITSYDVSETDTATSVTIHIHATIPSTVPLPGFTPTIDLTVTRAKERFTTPDSP